MNTFHGTYFPHPTSQGYPVTVSVEADGLSLQAQSDFSGIVVSPFWSANQIHPHAFRQGDKTVLEFGENPRQSLEVISPTFALTIKEAYPSASFHRNALPVPKSNWTGVWLLLLLVAGGLVAAYFFLLPRLADFMVRQLPPGVEQKIGAKIFEQMIKSEKIDSTRTITANQFLQRLHLTSPYPLELTVVESNTVNAFALPGGHMVVYTGLLNKIESPQEFAALLGHELAHVQNRHTLRAMARHFSHYLFLSILFNDVTGIAAILVENADQLKSLQYSRRLEEEADAEGFKLLKQNRLDPQGMRDLFKRLQAVKSGASVPALLSTHPLTEERLEHLEELVKKQPYSAAPSPQLEQVWNKLDKQ